LPRQALQPARQDRHRSAQTSHTLRTGTDWPVKPTIRPQRDLGFPERCFAAGQTKSSLRSLLLTFYSKRCIFLQFFYRRDSWPRITRTCCKAHWTC
jgi:hypothetical protein